MDVLYNIKRHEKKLFISEAQYARLLLLLSGHMQPDPYGCCEVSSLYFDTDNYAVIRSCLDFPQYKEKFRLRSYGPSEKPAVIFAEIKKKLGDTSYKCRVDLPPDRLPDFLTGEYAPEGNDQTVREIRYFMDRFHHPSPKVLIRCYREPWEGRADPNLRITFDPDLRWCTALPDSPNRSRERPLSVPGEIVMEIKSSASIPLWLCSFLSEEKIYFTNFSKYGNWYKTEVMKGKNHGYPYQHF